MLCYVKQALVADSLHVDLKRPRATQGALVRCLADVAAVWTRLLVVDTDTACTATDEACETCTAEKLLLLDHARAGLWWLSGG